MADIDDIPISDDDDSELDADSMSNREFDEIAFDVDNPLTSDYEFLGEETREIDGEEVLLIVPDAIANEDIFVAESDNLDAEEIEEIDNDSTAVAETIEDYDNTAVIPTIGAVTAGERVMVVLKNGVPTAMGSTGFGDDINLRVHEIEADYIKTEVIEAERARVNNLLANKADVSSLTAEQARVDNLLAGKASVSDLSAATGRIDDLEADHVSTDDLEAVNGKITNLETNALTANSAVIRDIQAETAKVENLTAESLSAATGYIAALKSASIEASDISADHATIATINSDYIKTSDLEAERADIDELLADKADISDLTAATGRIGALEADHVSTDDLEAEQVRVNNLLAGKASVSDLTAEQARVNDLLADKADISTLEAEYAHVTNGTIDNAKINHADVTGLNAEVASIADARIGQATIHQAQVENLSADYAKITNGKINTALIDVAAIVDEQVFTVTGNKATIEEINADSITVRNLHTANLVVDTAQGYVTIGDKKTPTKEALDELVGQLQNEIDGAVETFTSSAVPLLTNYPASDWRVSGATAEEQRKAYAKHVGDICYVQNAASAQNGYAYRFAYDSTEQTFKWVLIKDSDVTKALGDISDLQTFESETNTWIEETDEGLRTIRENHTSLSGIVDKTLVSSTQLWFSKANTTAPNKPTAEVTSTATSGNAWTTAVPAYNASYPNYFYCYQWKYADDTFGWSAVTRDIAMGESQAQGRKGVSDAAAASNKATAAQNTANANIKSSVQLWFTKANNSAPAKPTSVISTNNAATGNAWNLAVPTYSASYPHYFYCYQQQKGDGTYQWTDVIYDRATTENQAVARAALPSSTFETFKTTTFKEVVDTVGEQSTTITTLTEKTSTLANPNLTPWFSAQNKSYWNTLLDANYNYATGHGHASNTEGTKDITYLSDGWARIILDSRASAGNQNKSNYINTWVNRNQLADITPGGTYTWLIEVRNLNISKSTLRVRPSIGNATLDIFSAVPIDTTDGGCEFSEDGVKWIQVTAKSDLSNVTRDTRGYIYVITDVYVEADVRVSLYEGEYSGPYKPYVERLENIKEISNTVNTVKQTADTNTASITNLTKTVSDNKTEIESRASTIEQNLSGITTRVSKTESDLETISSPNLSPYFSHPLTDIYNVDTNPDGYWKENYATWLWTNLADGWGHIERSNTGSSTGWSNFYVMPMPNGLKPDTKYTFLVEWRNAVISGTGPQIAPTTVLSAQPDCFVGSIYSSRITDGSEGCEALVVTTISDLSQALLFSRGYITIPAGTSMAMDMRISIYEGEYSGSYKPYVDQTLISRVSTTETSIKQHDDAIELRATKTELAKETRQRKGTYAECTTDATTVNKAATISPAVSDFELYPGVTVAVCFTMGNRVASPKLNVNSTGLYPIVVNGTATPVLDAVKWDAYTTVMFTFDIRNQWRLVSTDEDVRRLTNAETKIEQNAEAITLRATKTEAQQMAQPNLSPWFSLQPIENDTEHWNINNGNTTFTPLEDGWVHLHNDNSSGTGAKRTDYQVMGSPSVTPGADYTWLFEYRNNNSTGNNNNYIVQSSERVQFWGNNVVKVLEGKSGGATTTLGPNQDFPPGTDGVYVKRVLKKAEAATSSHLDRTGTLYLGCLVCYAYAGAVADYDLRVSVYEGEYSGPYKPYSGTQLYASQAQLKVANDQIDLRVEKSGVIAAINASTEAEGGSAVKISADKVNVEGAAIFTSGRLSQSSLNDAYDSKGAAATVQGNLDNLQVGGTNLLGATANPSSKQIVLNSAGASTFGDITNYNDAISLYSFEDFDGHSNSVKWTTSSAGNRGVGWYTKIGAIKAGETYTFSCKVMSSVATIVHTHTAWRNGSATADYTGWTVAGSVAIAADEWTDYSYSFKPHSSAKLDWEFYVALCFSGNSGGATFRVAHAKLEHGNRASDWSPAPEDQTAYVDSSIDGIQVGGRNYILNSASISASGIGSASGSRKEYLPVNVGQSYMGIAAGTEVVISFDLYMTVNTANPILQVYNTNNKGPKAFSSVKTGGGSSPGALLNFTAAVGDVIDERVSVVGYINDRNSPTLTYNFLEFYSNYGSSNWFSVSNLKMEIGNRATDWTPAPEDVTSRTQRIYYRTSSSTAPTSQYMPTAWVTETGDKWAANSTTVENWTAKATKLTNGSGTKYPYLFTCEQRQMGDGTLAYTTVLLDETTTVIDGGTIITGSVHANSLDADSVKANIVQTTDLSATKITSGDIATERMSANVVKAVKAKVSDLYALVAKIGGFVINATSIFSGTAVTSNADNSIALSTADFTRTVNGTSRAGLRFAIGDKFGVTGDGTLYANGANITSINAANISSGSISADRIKANVISAVNNGTGTINADKINVSAIKIGDLSGSIGGRNLLVGSSTGTGWLYSTFDADTITYTRATTATGESYVTAPSMIFEPGETYTVSCYAKISGPVRSLDIYKVHQSGGGSHQQRQSITLTTEYQRISWTFECNADSEEQAYIRFDNNGSTTSGTNAILYIKEPKLEKGSKATDWTPAPEDQTAYVDNSVNSIQIGGRNLLRDSTFTAVLGTYWVVEGLTASVSNSSLVINGASASGNKRIYQGLDYFKHEAGITYTVSCDIVSTATCKISFGRRYADVDEGGVTLDVTTTKKRVSGTYQTIAAAFCIGQPTNNATVTISNIKLEIGNKATDWTPAPEDQTAYVDSIAVGGTNLLLHSNNRPKWPINNPTAYHLARVTLSENLVMGDTYTIQIWGTVGRSDKSGTAVFNVYWGGGSVPLGTLTPNSARDYWTLTFTAPSGAHNDKNNAYIHIYNTVPIGASGTTYSSNIIKAKLERGNKPTDWSPAPEDISQMVKINTAVRNFTTAQWKSFGAVGHVENWTTGSSYNNSHIHVGDTAYLTGTVTDGVKGTATIIGTVTGINGTSTVTMSSTQLIFGGDSVDSASKTATNYIADIAGGVKIHPSGSDTTGVWITDDIDIMRDGVSVAMFGTDENNQPIARIGREDKAHTEQTDDTFYVCYPDPSDNTNDYRPIYLKNTTHILKPTASDDDPFKYRSTSELKLGSNDANGFISMLPTLIRTRSTEYGQSRFVIMASSDDHYDNPSIELHASGYLDPDKAHSYDGYIKLYVPYENNGSNNGYLFLESNARVINFLNATINAAYINPTNPLEATAIPNLDASKITGGTFDAERIPNLDASKITGGTFDAERIPNLDASKITGGTFNAARIPSLNASKINAGTFNAARIPNLNASKINAGTLNSARLPTVPIDKGGTGDTGVETVTAQGTIFTSVTSGMTLSSLTCATWGKMCMLSFVVKPSAAQTSAFVIGTLATAYRPVAACTANPYHSSVATARIQTNGTVQMTAAPANEIPVSFTYLLA